MPQRPKPPQAISQAIAQQAIKGAGGIRIELLGHSELSLFAAALP
jgi:hypothetical protein